MDYFEFKDLLNTNEIIPDHEFYHRLIVDDANMDFDAQTEKSIMQVNEIELLGDSYYYF